MHRLKDFYNHKIQDISYSYETYEEWLTRIGVSEEEDDRGVYGDDEPTWMENPPLYCKTEEDE